MKKISSKRIIIGVLIGGGIFFPSIFGLWNWLMSPDFPYLWISDERWCAQETIEQPYISQEHYQYFFENCLIRRSKGSDENIYIPIDEPVVIEETG